MRFKAKNTDGEWVEGYLLKESSLDSYIIMEEAIEWVDGREFNYGDKWWEIDITTAELIVE
jgi:hypothetical protein